MIRRWPHLLIAVPIALAAADALLWTWATHALSANLASWRTQMQAEGWTIEAADETAGGFPFTAALALSTVRLEGANHSLPGGFTWQASRVVLSVSLFAPLTLSVAPDGEQVLRIANGPRMVYHADRMETLLPLGRGQPQSASLEAEGLAGGIQGSRHPQDVRVERVAFRLTERPLANGAIDGDLDLHARQIELPDIGRWPMGAVIGEAGADLAVYLPRLSGYAPRAAAAAAWRDAGGKVTLRDTRLKWGPMTLAGEATLTLDSRLQPAGRGVAVLTGGAEAFDALVSGGTLPQGVGATAKAVLSAMAQLPGGNGVRLPFTLRDNTISVGPIPIARVNDVVW